MSIYAVPIDFTIQADSPEEAKFRIEEFLLRAITELRRDYSQILDYEAPFGYPTEKIPNP